MGWIGILSVDGDGFGRPYQADGELPMDAVYHIGVAIMFLPIPYIQAVKESANHGSEALVIHRPRFENSSCDTFNTVLQRCAARERRGQQAQLPRAQLYFIPGTVIAADGKEDHVRPIGAGVIEMMFSFQFVHRRAAEITVALVAVVLGVNIDATFQPPDVPDAASADDERTMGRQFCFEEVGRGVAVAIAPCVHTAAMGAAFSADSLRQVQTRFGIGTFHGGCVGHIG